MYLKEYVDICQSEGLNPYNLLSLYELNLAKKRAIEIAKATKRINDSRNNLSADVVDRLNHWIKEQDEQRMAHMFNALDYAETINGKSKNWDEHMRRKWKQMGMDIPEI